MGLFMDKLCRLVPVIKKQYVNGANNTMYQKAVIEGVPEDYFATPYLKAVKDFGESCGEIMGKRIFLITEEENIGLKAAFGIMNYPIYAKWEEICACIEDSGYYSKELTPQIANEVKSEIRLISVKDYSVRLDGKLPENEVFYFKGLGENINDNYLFLNQFENKLSCIMSCKSAIQFVQLQKEQLDTPWARELLRDRECEIVYLPRADCEYYVHVLEELLEGERYRLEEKIVPERLVRNIMKKCADKFDEEDIAWSLDQAVKRARLRGEYHVLAAADFAFDFCDEISALENLEKMTGLENMKRLAFEYAALGREQMRNHKLSEVCKHVVFKGNPGTGKTMCGRILAQVMAEQGQSNGVFIQASRKDIIGEHVGETAPKVAGLFAQARNGVLFVDEAGFLLQGVRVSYNQEAIKEFVRYMELYQDVTVIFALYPNEAEEWLKLDAGLSSRISRVIDFEDYTERELLEIAECMCVSRGYEPEENAKESIRTFIKRRHVFAGEEFGNAREMRKLVESAIIARSIRCYEKMPKEQRPMLLQADFEYGAKRLCRESGRKSSQIGFATA